MPVIVTVRNLHPPEGDGADQERAAECETLERVRGLGSLAIPGRLAGWGIGRLSQVRANPAPR
jgi:hypothetical protein